jgi:calcineurin-like phosphoesterase family protein
MIHFTSDNHFFHTKVMEYSARPYETGGEMNDKMRIAWNRQVGPKDTVWMLGDVGFARYDTLVPYIESLNGFKHLVLGNHDKELSKKRELLLKDKVFQSIQDYKELKVDGHLFVLCHYAMRTWNKAQYESMHLFGHTHGYLALWTLEWMTRTSQPSIVRCRWRKS